MSYEGAAGEVSATHRRAKSLPRLRGRNGSMLFVAPGSVTRGQFGLFRREMKPRSGGPDPHFHRTFSESFYLLRGTVHLFNGDTWLEARAGDFLYVPKGGIHAFRNNSDQPASMLILFAPGTPRERYFIEVDEIAKSGRQLSDQEWTDLLARHDQHMVG